VLSGGFAFLALLDDPADSVALTQLLARVRRPECPVPAVFRVPPVRGLAFFADPARQGEVDAWWSAEVPGSAHPVYLLMDAEGLEDWLPGMDGTFYIGLVDPSRAGAYPSDGRAQCLLPAGPLDFAVAVIQDHSEACGTDPTLFDQADALRMAALSGSPSLRPGARREGGPERAVGRDASPRGGPPAPTPTGAVVGPPASGTAAPPRPGVTEFPMPERAAGPRLRLTTAALSGLLRGRSGFRPRSDAELAQQLAGRGTTVVVIGSRKGGVGKTSFAAGISIVAGSVLDQIGHMACIVDANIANPDAWGQMNLPAGSATVRDTISALLANRDVPPPVHAATPALACYPEVREAIEYSRTAIRRLADHLRHRYTLVVVDMSNRLPDPTAGPEAAVAAYWLEVADILVLPTTSNRADFNGALDYLEVSGLPPTVVAYIVPDARRLRDNPTTLEYVRAIRQRALTLVEVPDDPNAVRLAGMEGLPVEQLSARLGRAYRELTEVIAIMPRRPRR
jgi:MinD-like ATPase involved in chromosome partitioning or flagellar assembly